MCAGSAPDVSANACVSASIILSAPREQVFDYLQDIANHPEFTDHYLVDWHLTRIDSVGPGAGARFRSRGPGCVRRGGPSARQPGGPGTGRLWDFCGDLGPHRRCVRHEARSLPAFMQVRRLTSWLPR